MFCCFSHKCGTFNSWLKVNNLETPEQYVISHFFLVHLLTLKKQISISRSGICKKYCSHRSRRQKNMFFYFSNNVVKTVHPWAENFMEHWYQVYFIFSIFSCIWHILFKIQNAWTSLSNVNITEIKLYCK